MRKITLFLLFAFSIIFCNNLLGKDYNNYNFPFFTGRLPSAKSEAMGRTNVASYDGAFTAFYNPAGIFLSKGLNTAFSYSSPYYLAKKANYNFFGITYHVKNIGFFGINRFHYSFGEKLYITSSSGPGDRSEFYTPSTSFYTLSYAKEIMTNFSVGINFNLYADKIANKNYKSYPIDVGLLKIFPIIQQEYNNQKLNIGISVKNVFGSKVDYLVSEQKESLPVVLRVGSSYELSVLKQDYLPNLFLFGIVFNVEYEDILNFKYKSGIKLGAEFSFFEILYARLGYYSFKLDPSPTNGRDKLTDFTFGFGIKLPVNEFVKREIPLTFFLDVTNLEQPSYIKNFSDWDNFSTYSIKINWAL